MGVFRADICKCIAYISMITQRERCYLRAVSNVKVINIITNHACQRQAQQDCLERSTIYMYIIDVPGLIMMTLI